MEETNAGGDNISAQKAEEEHKAKEKVMSMEAMPTQKKSVSKGLVIGIVAVVILAIAGIGISALSKSTTQAAKVYIIASSATKVKLTNTTVVTKSATSKPTSTPKPTVKPNLAATQRVLNSAATAKSANALAAQASQWDLKLSDKFDNTNDPYGWYVGTDVSQYGKGEAKITNGKYLWSYSAVKGVFYRSWVYTISLTDFYLTVNAQEKSDCGTCDFGIVFRNNAGNDYYYYGISSKQQQYFFYLYKGEWTTLIHRTNSSTIRSGEPNKLSLIAQGSHFVFFVNDQFVAEITDSTLPNGPMGLGIELNPNDKGLFEFDDVVLRAPPK